MDNTQPQVLVGLFISSSPVQFVVFNEERTIGGGWLMATSLIVDASLELRDDWRIDDSSATNSWVGRSTLARSIDVAFIMGASDVATDNISVNHGNGLAIGDAMIFERPRVTRGFSLLDRVVEARQRATAGWPRCCLKGAAGVSAANVAVGEFHLQQLGVEILSSDAIVDGSIIDRSLVIDAIHKLDNDSRVTNDSFAISIPVPSMIIEKIHRSTMAEQELPQSIQWETEQYIPFDISDVRLDYVVLSDAEIEWGNMEVLLVAVKRDKVNDYTSVVSWLRYAKLQWQSMSTHSPYISARSSKQVESLEFFSSDGRQLAHRDLCLSVAMSAVFLDRLLRVVSEGMNSLAALANKRSCLRRADVQWGAWLQLSCN